MSGLARNRILVGNVHKRLADIPDQSIDCVITSPPYFQLRDYGISGQVGLEANVQGWVSELRLALNGLARVLKPTGSMWLNLGDTYSRHTKYGAAPKSLLLAPERLLLALSDNGWLVRNKIVWAKTNPMPHAVADRLNNSYDLVYFLTRSRRYYFDLDAIRMPHRSSTKSRRSAAYPPDAASAPLWRQRGGGNRGLAAQRARGRVGHELGKNPGDVWPLAAASFRGAHFATFPLALVERPLLATCPELICNQCETPFKRVSQMRREERSRQQPRPSEPRVLRYWHTYNVIRKRGPLRPDCACGVPAHPGVVLDPFFGAGTVGVAAERHGRAWIGIELNPAYVKLAERRLAAARAIDGTPVRGTTSVVAPTEHPSIPERGNEP